MLEDGKVVVPCHIGYIVERVGWGGDLLVARQIVVGSIYSRIMVTLFCVNMGICVVIWGGSVGGELGDIIEENFVYLSGL